MTAAQHAATIARIFQTYWAIPMVLVGLLIVVELIRWWVNAGDPPLNPNLWALVAAEALFLLGAFLTSRTYYGG